MSEIENLKIGNGGTLHIVGNEDIVANAWAAGKTYVKNKSYVIREHRLYVCNVTHTSVEPFDATKWTEITVIGAIDNALDMTDTASGAIATFESEYALPLRDCTIDINAVQEGTGTPSPDNVRPITGFTGANIHVADNETPHIIDNVTAITWQSEAGTVYGGSLDVTSGKLVIKYARIKISDMTWNIGGGFFYSNLPLKKNGTTNIHCECLRVVDVSSVSEMVNGDIKGFPSNTNMYIKNTDWASATDLYNAIGDYYIVYELATPITVQLTPTEIKTILGVNNIWADTGDTSLEYYTKRGEQTVRIAEGVAVDVINNKIIDNLTTTNKTLVGAVNSMIIKSNASWIANSSSAYGTALTDSINVTAGVWLITWGHPSQSATLGCFVDGILTNSDITDNFMSFDNGMSYAKGCILVRFTGNSTIKLCAGGSASVSFSNIERGFLRAVKLK